MAERPRGTGGWEGRRLVGGRREGRSSDGVIFLMRLCRHCTRVRVYSYFLMLPIFETTIWMFLLFCTRMTLLECIHLWTRVESQGGYTLVPIAMVTWAGHSVVFMTDLYLINNVIMVIKHVIRSTIHQIQLSSEHMSRSTDFLT